MNLSHKRIAEIRTLVSAGVQLGRTEAEDLLGHNDHLTELCEARARLVLRAESESETLRGLYQMHKQTETREMRELKAELAGLKTGYEAYERVNAELTQRIANLELCQTASLGVSGIIKSAASELGFDAAGEDSALDYLIGVARSSAALRAECKALRKDASLHTQLQRAAELLSGAWSIEIAIEHHAGWIDVFDEGGNKVMFDGEGHLADQVSDAIDLAMTLSKEASQ